MEKEVYEKYRKITLALIEKGLTITTMESCTSGQIASLITDTEGSSAIFKGAFITYSNEAKVMQGVPSAVIEKYGVYSRETASAMAKAARRAFGADISVGVTGSMGNVDTVNRDSVPGEVYYAVATNEGAENFFAKIPPQETRLLYKLFVADLVADKLEEVILHRV